LNFNDVHDREEFLWVLVENKEEADNFYSLSKIEILRPSFIVADETGLINTKME